MVQNRMGGLILDSSYYFAVLQCNFRGPKIASQTNAWAEAGATGVTEDAPSHMCTEITVSACRPMHQEAYVFGCAWLEVAGVLCE